MNNKVRVGIRIRSAGIEPDLKEAVKKFVKWLRSEYDFPIRVPVYLSKQSLIKAMDGDYCYSIFFEPNDRTQEPYIRIATGDFHEQAKKNGRDNAVAGILVDIALNLQYYFNWCEGKVVRKTKAKALARNAVERYSRTVDSP